MTNGEKFPFKWARPGMDLTRENYVDSHVPIVAEQLQKAGVRLAGMLNSAFDPEWKEPRRETAEHAPETAARATK